MMRTTLSVAVLAALLTGCSGLLAPDYHRPDAPVPTAWPTGPAYDKAPKGQSVNADEIGWREFIVDARLRQLVELALANNRDLRISALNIEKARAQYGIARADLFPSINASAAGTHAQTAQDLTSAGAPRVTHSYTAGVGFSAYELDFFGRVQNLKDAALESYLNTVEARNAQQITLISEVASNYLTLAANQELLRLAERTLGSQRETYELTRRRFQMGVASQLDVSAAQTTLNSAQVDVASYTTAVAQARNALTLVVGTQVPDGLLPSAGLFDGPAVVRDVPVGVSSEVLLRRPDLVADEHTLKAYNANIGAARAAFFPSITLTANVGSGSTSLSRLFGGNNGTWSFVPSLNLPIFSGGSLLAQLDSAKASRAIGVAQYEKDIQTAFKEAADALAQRGTIGEQLKAQQSLADAASLSYKLAQARYRTGIDSYLSMLVYQRTMYADQQALINTKLTQQANLVTLYKVLGGGVREHTQQAAAD